MITTIQEITIKFRSTTTSKFDFADPDQTAPKAAPLFASPYTSPELITAL